MGDILGSIVVSIPACHAGDRGSIPRRGGQILFLIKGLLPGNLRSRLRSTLLILDREFSIWFHSTFRS